MLCTTRAGVFCVYCRYYVGKGLSLAKKEEAFVTIGFDNWKKAHQGSTNISNRIFIKSLF